MHLGRGSEAAQQTTEADLLACLRAHADAVTHLYLVGDVFERYIEYRHLVPKGFVRFQGLLAEWTDRGVPVTYLVGNHDPWHRDYFAQELGVRVVFEALHEPMAGRSVYLHHGDGLARGASLYRTLRPLLRHPLPVWLYRTLLPGDLGMRLADAVNRRFGNHDLEPTTIADLQAHAQHLLATTDADLVVHGHCHQPELSDWPGGQYLNPGAWYDFRTFARLTPDGTVHLLRWAGTEAVSAEPLPTDLMSET